LLANLWLATKCFLGKDSLVILILLAAWGALTLAFVASLGFAASHSIQAADMADADSTEPEATLD
jgi:hypothetical protein